MTTKTTGPERADTIVLIHGVWLTAASWEQWAAYYRRAGYDVLAPAYSGLDEPVETLRADPAPIGRLTFQDAADGFEAVIRSLDKPPIIIGHCVGGTIVQLMLDRGLGAAGIAIGAVPVHGVQVAAAAEPADGPLDRPTVVPLTLEQFTQLITGTRNANLPMEAYERYYIPAPGRIVWHGVLAGVGTDPATAVDFAKPDRPPLLFIAGGEDRLTPPALAWANYQRYRRRSAAIVEYREFPAHSHYMLGQPGWQEVADCALLWAEQPTTD